MVNDPVMVEFSRDVVNDEGHSELENQVSATVMYPKVMGTYLNDNTNQNEPLIFAL